MALIFNSWLTELFAVLLAICVNIYYYFSLKYFYWKKKDIPYIEPSFPLGNLTELVVYGKTISQSFDSMYQKLIGYPFGGMFLINRPALLLRDPEIIKTILVKDFNHFHDRGFYFDEKGDPMTGHLISLEGTRWRHLHQKLTPAFTTGKMKLMFPLLLECERDLEMYLAPLAKRNGEIEIQEVMAKFTTDVIATCAFGIQSNSLTNEDSEFRKMGRKILEPTIRSSIRNLLLFLAPNIAAIVKIPTVTKDVSDFFRDIVKETMDYREKSNISRNDFLQLLINIKNKSKIDDNSKDLILEKQSEHFYGDIDEKTRKKDANTYDVKGMTLNELTANVFIFFLAGFETSSSTISFCLYELALNQDLQRKLREEVDHAMEEHGGEMTYDAILGMEFMDQVVSETLRKYPPAPLVQRVCTKEYQLSGTKTKIEVGTPVIVPVHALHHDPLYFPDPESFIPARFTEDAKSRRHPFAYLPFGEGPRACIGLRFGLMQTKLGIASVISRYQLDICKEKTAIPLKMEPTSFFTTARGGIHLKISPRSSYF